MIILLGVPGSGKSTQGELLVKRGKVKWFSVGDILRNQMFGKHKNKMQTGKLLDDSDVIEILQKEIQRIGDNPELVLDGFPRSIPQTKWLLTKQSDDELHISAVVHLFAEESVVEKRLMSRGRYDDTPETIANRFDIYQKTFQPIIKSLKNDGVRVLEINADQTPEAIHLDIAKGLNKMQVKV